MPYTVCPETNLICDTGLGVDTTLDFLNTEEETALRNKECADYYQDTPVSYRLDSRGFRNPMEIEQYESGYLLAVGCSHTFGAGNAYKDLWHTKLAAALGTKSLSLGLQGGNLELGIVNSIRLMKHFAARPRAVVYQHPEVNRKVYVRDDDELMLTVDNEYSRERFEAEVKQGIVTDFYQTTMQSEIADAYWLAMGIPVYHFTFGLDGFTPFSPHILNFDSDKDSAELPQFARDLTHNGPQSHQDVVDYFAPIIKSDSVVQADDSQLEQISDEEQLKRKLEMLRKRDPFVYR